MLEAVERLLVRGKDLATDCDLVTDWDLRIENSHKIILNFRRWHDLQFFHLNVTLKYFSKKLVLRDKD